MAMRGLKRAASPSLDEATNVDSPSFKRARVEDEEKPASEVPAPAPAQAAHTNGAALDSNGASREQDAEDSEEESEEADDIATRSNEDELERDIIGLPKRQEKPTEGYTDLYMDTINRKRLDFDFEKLCSVTLLNINVYACLVCGKYYQGRGPKTQAYHHSLDEDHHVYIKLQNKKVYVLPEGYEVINSSLEDIKYVVDPTYTKQEVAKIDKEKQMSYDLLHRQYVPGYIGMNNIKANDYFNVVMQSLSHVTPLRNFFLLSDFSKCPELAQRYSTLVRKMWNPRAFKVHVSPHELIQEVALRSNKKYTLSSQADPVEFLSWFLNNLHLALGGSRTKPGSSKIQKVFQGSLKLESQRITARADIADRLRFEDASIEETVMNFLILPLDLPAAPLFQSDNKANIIPTVPLTTILSKYDGRSAQEHLDRRRRYRLMHPLPPYLLFHVKRFGRNKFKDERNQTIVTFSPKALDMAPYVEPNPKLHDMGEPILYDLVANITHEGVYLRDDSVEGEAEKKVWKVQVRDKSRDDWWQIQDLWVDKTQRETLFTKEAYLMVWERRAAKKDDKGKGKEPAL
ncbi:cysteine proteinase [Aulographum hederae CBS 113979]|uniref:Cysteine proteinase n=1 Tax=Aulographum hederae CBS 113979 TaxID=1176131 RepID=A0A6G1H3B4_9PEZI|nr:cysteine proteinase [Aulographum hederae CBS 113979]